MIRVLVVDDHPVLRAGLEAVLLAEAQVAGAHDLVDKVVGVDVLFDAIRVAGRRPGAAA